MLFRLEARILMLASRSGPVCAAAAGAVGFLRWAGTVVGGMAVVGIIQKLAAVSWRWRIWAVASRAACNAAW